MAGEARMGPRAKAPAGPPPELRQGETLPAEEAGPATPYLRQKKPGSPLLGASRFKAAANAVGAMRPATPNRKSSLLGESTTELNAPPSASKLPPPQSALKRDILKNSVALGSAEGNNEGKGGAEDVAPTPTSSKKDVEQTLWMVTVNNECALLVAARAVLAPVGSVAYAKSESLDRVLHRMRPYFIEKAHRLEGAAGGEATYVQGWDPARRFRVETGGEGATPLHQCLLRGSPESLLAARAILRRYPGALLDTYTGGIFGGENCLHMAVVEGLEKSPIDGGNNIFATFDETAKRLPEGALAKLMTDDTSAAGRFFSPGQMCYYGGLPLAFAASVGTPWHLSWLLERGAVIDAQDSAAGNTALHLAVMHSNRDCYVFLRKRGASNLENLDGLTPMHLAVQRGDADMFSFIMSQHATPMWQYGTTRCNLYAIDELHGSSRFFDTKRKTAIELVAQHHRVELIAPSNECLEYVSDIRISRRGEQKRTFRMSDGPRPPEVNRSILLIVAENCWANFAGPLVRRRFALYLAHLAAVTSVILYDDESAGAAGTFLPWGRMLALASTCHQTALELWTIKANVGKHASAVSSIMSVALLGHCLLLLLAVAVEEGPLLGFTERSSLAQSISALSLVLGFFYLAHFLGCFRSTGPLVCMLIEIVRVDVTSFALVFSSLLLGYGTAFYELLRPVSLTTQPASVKGAPPTPIVSIVEGFSSWPEAMLTTFRMSLGDTSFESMTTGLLERIQADVPVTLLAGRLVFQPRLVMFYALYSTFLFGSSIILINLLIAMMGRSFAVVDDRNIGEYLVRRTEVMLRLEATQSRRQRARCFREFLNEPLSGGESEGGGEYFQDLYELRVECKDVE